MSTADINAVSRTDKFGHSMPILKTVDNTYPKLKEYRVEHENRHVGFVEKWPGGWFAYKPNGLFNSEVPYSNRHAAVASLFDPIDPATAMDRKR
jgi:hypothetical protein